MGEGITGEMLGKEEEEAVSRVQNSPTFSRSVPGKKINSDICRSILRSIRD